MRTEAKKNLITTKKYRQYVEYAESTYMIKYGILLEIII